MPFTISHTHGRIIRAMKALERITAYTFTEKEMRGLPADEKEFIRDNGYKSYIDLRAYNGKLERYYMFISRDPHGKKHIYALHKDQVLNPSGHYLGCSRLWNDRCWLTFQGRRRYFDKYTFEHRFFGQFGREIYIFV